MKCKICDCICEEVFETLILKKYNIKYFQCQNCRFIQTEKVFWLQEAYESAITDLDIGLVSRNIHYSEIVSKVISKYFNPAGRFLDYGGGYGMFVRLMRDKGFDFYRYDIYCQNLFAKYFDYKDLPANQRFNVLTAFEVFEHLDDPLAEMKKMLSFSDNLIFSTELQPNAQVTPDNWWYFIPETGQHIALYSAKSLKLLAAHFNLNYYSHGSLHIFSSRSDINLPKLLNAVTITKVARKVESLVNRRDAKTGSLLQKDFNYIKSKL